MGEAICRFWNPSPAFDSELRVLSMPPPFARHIFVCTNRRPDESPKGSCAAKGSEEVRLKFKQELDARGLKSQARANAAGCLDACERGVSVVVYPDGVWYGGVTVADVATIVEEHIVGGRPVQRLLMKPIPKDRP
jgi:(2Fe-2S) ferredoxin